MEPVFWIWIVDLLVTVNKYLLPMHPEQLSLRMSFPLEFVFQTSVCKLIDTGLVVPYM